MAAPSPPTFGQGPKKVVAMLVVMLVTSPLKNNLITDRAAEDFDSLMGKILTTTVEEFLQRFPEAGN